MLDLSIIIPIYNTPIDALQRCFSSAETLGVSDYEVLLIDDGSQEPVGKFCAEYAREHSAFRYLHKENGGVSSARNYGLDQAKGRYVMFVDADDQVLGEPISQDCVDNDRDLVLFDMYLSENGADHLWPSLPCPAGVVDASVLLKYLIIEKSLNSPCVKMYRRELIEAHQLRFRTDMVTGEDWLFVSQFARQMQTVEYVNAPCYRYFREESSSQSRTARFPDAMIDNHRIIMATKRELASLDPNPEKVVAQAAAMHIEDMFNTAAELLLFRLLTKERKQTIHDCVKEATGELGASGYKKARTKSFVLLRCPFLLWPLAKLREFYLKHKH